MAIRLYYEKKQSLVGKTVYFAQSIFKIKKSDRKMLTRKHAPVDDTVGEERLLVGTPCLVTAQTPNAALIFVTWQNISGVTFKGRLPLRFFSDTPPHCDMYARAKLDAADNTDLVPYFDAPVQQLEVNSHCLIKEWESARQACKSLGMSLKPFARNLRQGLFREGGSYWQLVEPHATIDDSKKPYREKKRRRFLIVRQCDADNKMRPGTTVRYVGHDWAHGNTSINHGAFGVIEGRTPGHPNRFAVRYPNNDESVHCLAERLREVKHYLR